ncbi:MAG: GntR family transcriptional regulator [Leptolinea sp.]|nr:GntR family transcriptional regulator [Leptolinea sp.]
MNSVAGRVQVDFRSEEPLYLQIARQIEELVGNGTLQVGDQLPTVREMAAELSINFNTVARAYRLLDESRIISTQRGRGTYIWEKPTEETRHLLKEAALEDVLLEMIARVESRGYSFDEILETLQKIKREKRDKNQEIE